MLTNLLLGQTAEEKLYVEDVFSTWLYTGNNSSQTITNGIDLAGKGGMVWYKTRSFVSGNDANHHVLDTVRGRLAAINTNNTNASSTSGSLSSFNSNGFTAGYTQSPLNYASWTFREAPKFFDIVTWTGSGVNRAISHSLGATPGMIIVKRTDAAANWAVYHRGLNNGTNPQNFTIYLNLTNEQGGGRWNSTAPTSTQFTVGTDDSVNASGGSYVAYLFAHDTTADGIVQCGSFTGASTVDVSLGWEPQFFLIKNATSAGSWFIFDTMRGASFSNAMFLQPNVSDEEADVGAGSVLPTATGFTFKGSNFGYTSGTITYMAIRRGPMRTPTDATKVFNPIAYTTANASSQVLSVGFPADTILDRERTTTGSFASNWPMASRLTGTGFLRTTQQAAEATFVDAVNGWDEQNSIDLGGILVGNGNFTAILYAYRRAPSFFDVVCYTGNAGQTGVPSSNQIISHNLTVAPELIIIKNRSATTNWPTWRSSSIGALNTTDSFFSTATNYITAVGASTFTVNNPGNTNYDCNTSGSAYVAYLFATCPGVSKVGSYTGTGTTLQINCGFTNGARYVLIKRTDSSGDWYVWDTARGIIAGNDPYLLLNSTAAEVTNTDYVDAYSAGFELSSTAPAALNANGGTYIYLAIA